MVSTADTDLTSGPVATVPLTLLSQAFAELPPKPAYNLRHPIPLPIPSFQGAISALRRRTMLLRGFLHEEAPKDRLFSISSELAILDKLDSCMIRIPSFSFAILILFDYPPTIDITAICRLFSFGCFALSGGSTRTSSLAPQLSNLTQLFYLYIRFSSAIVIIRHGLSSITLCLHSFALVLLIGTSTRISSMVVPSRLSLTTSVSATAVSHRSL